MGDVLLAVLRTRGVGACAVLKAYAQERPKGVFEESPSMERILYAVFTYENLSQGTGTPFSPAPNS